MSEEDWTVAIELKNILRKLNDDDKKRVYEIVSEDIVNTIAKAQQEAVKGFIKFVIADAMFSLGTSPLVVYIDEDVAGVRKGFSYTGDFLDLIHKYLPEKELNQIEKELQQKLKTKSKG